MTSGRNAAWYPGYVLSMLAIANAFNAIDRNIVGLLAEPIKHELHISDTQIGLLTGFAFAVFYAIFGVPIARWSDRGTRRTILALGIALWSAMTVLCGFATSFTLLLLARIGVGIGEAAAAPPSLSLIADYYSKERRPRAVAVFHSAIYVGLAATAAVGWIARASGWRVAFVAVGIAGILFAMVVRATVAEPVRGALDAASERNQAQQPLLESMRFMLTQRAYLLILVSLATTMMSAGSFSAWGASFLRRIHDLDLGQVASVFGPANGLGGFIGTLTGGIITTWMVRRTGDERWMLWMPAIALFLAVPVAVVFLFAPSLPIAVAALAMESFLWAMKNGPCFALALSLVPPSMRALATSIMLLATGVVGNGSGPLIVGALSDALQPIFGVHSIQYAMIFCPVAVLAGAIALVGAGNGTKLVTEPPALRR